MTVRITDVIDASGDIVLYEVEEVSTGDTLWIMVEGQPVEDDLVARLSRGERPERTFTRWLILARIPKER